MIKKAARIHLSRAQADLAFAEAKTLPGAKVEMIPEGGDLFTVTVVWDDSGAAVADEEATAFIRDESPPISPQSATARARRWRRSPAPRGLSPR